MHTMCPTCLTWHEKQLGVHRPVKGSGGRGSAPPAPESAEHPLGPGRNLGALDVDADYGDLLHRLRLLPIAWPHQTLLWLPKNVRSMASQVLTGVLAEATCALGRDSLTAWAECAQLIMRNIGPLLFRPPWSASDPKADPSNPTIITTVKRRLQLATESKWMLLVNECLEEVRMRSQDVPPKAACRDSQLSPKDYAQAAKRGHRSGAKACLQHLTGLPNVEPSADVDEQVSRLYRTKPLSTEEAAALEAELARARAVKKSYRPMISRKLVTQRVHRLRAQAGPGPSGFRNAYLQCLITARDGPTALTNWCQAWSGMDLSPDCTALWQHMLVRPFYKSDGASIRPIICSEALLKIAIAVAVDAVMPSLRNTISSDQYGLGHNAGPTGAVRHMAAELTRYPGDISAALDLTNAFGSVQWTTVITPCRC